MLKRLAKAGIFTQIIVIILLAAVHYSLPQAKLLPATDPGQTAPFGEWIYRLIADFPGLAQPLVVLLITALAIVLNALLIRHDISPRQSLLPAITALILMLFAPDSYHLIVTLACLILLLFSLHNVMGIYGQQYPFSKVLNATFAISIASMISPPVILFLFFVWFGFFTFRINSWREWIISLMGIILPYFYLALLYFWNGNLIYAFGLYSEILDNINLTIQRPALLEFVGLGIFAFWLIISGLRFLADTAEKVISIRKKMWIINHFLLAGFAALMLSGSMAMSMLPLIYVPASAMIAYAVSNGSRPWVHDVILLLYLAVAFANRIYF
jgi:hypothetical protein